MPSIFLSWVLLMLYWRLRPKDFLNPPASDCEIEGEREMRKRERKIGLGASGLLACGLLMGLLTFRSTPAIAHVVPSPCDFTTGGGFVITDKTITDGGNHANFGLVGGCKNGGFFRHVNFVDHDTNGFFARFHLSPTNHGPALEPPAGPPPARRRHISCTA